MDPIKKRLLLAWWPIIFLIALAIPLYVLIAFSAHT